MFYTLYEWAIRLPSEIMKLFVWFLEPLPFLNIVPLHLFSAVGIIALIGVLLTRLVVGG